MNIIYHIPIPLDKSAKSASGIRPIKILEAFITLGYSVDVISGYVVERKQAVKAIKKKILSGVKYEFCYSESSTMPTLLTEKKHFPCLSAPDFSFFKFLKKRKIPVKLFYRDIYWCFQDYYKQVGIKGYFARSFYKYDIYQYLKYLDTLYVPCLKMLDYIPSLKKIHCEELPSGCSLHDHVFCDKNHGKFIYVGGIGNHYDLHKMVSVFSRIEHSKLLLCVRKIDWNSVRESYALGDNIELIHASGSELDKYYSSSNKAMLFVEPSLYWEFAIPYKLFEYLGWGLPIIASEDTAVGEYVKKYNIGWTIPYTEESLKKLLDFLLANPEDVLIKQENVKKVAQENTWEKRCEQIARRTQ